MARLFSLVRFPYTDSSVFFSLDTAFSQSVLVENGEIIFGVVEIGAHCKRTCSCRLSQRGPFVFLLLLLHLD
jgi:hypothetical protein